MSWALPAAIIGSSIIGGLASSSGAKAQANAANAASDVQRYMYDQTRTDYAPYREVGTSALRRLASEANQPFDQTPGYQFRFNEGLRAVNQNASAAGMLNSGQRLRALTQYGQGMAEQGYGEYANRLASLAGVGQTATGQTAAAGQAAAQGMGNAAMAAGQAKASGSAGWANAVNSGLNNAFLMYALSPNQGGAKASAPFWSAGLTGAP
jgi:hypothetical protein